MDPWYIVLIIMVLVGLGLVLSSSRAQAQAGEKARLAATERKLDVVMAHLGVAEPPPEEPDVVRFLENGQKIHAIKAYRDRTGAGLAEAKAVVERIARERGLDQR